MKSTLSLLALTFMLSSSFSSINPGTDEIIVTGLRFDKARIATFKKLPEHGAFTLEKNEVLRPTKDYQIVYAKSDKALVLIPKTTTYSTFKQLNGYEEIELPGGILIGCMCSGANDDCHFDNSKIEYKFECKGSCRCYMGIVFDWTSPPLQFETSIGGGWLNF